jgi:hypothetical protein
MPPTVLFKKNDLKSIAKIKKLRTDPETYTWMLNHVVPLIVGVKYYKTECRKTLPTSWLTTSSEAFAVLCLENYYHHVVDTAGNKTVIRKPKWTSEGVRAKRNQGWGQEGISKFDEYCEKVKENRAQTESKLVDTQYMETKREETTKDEERKRKRVETRNLREVGWNVAYVDDWSGDEGPPSKKNNDGDSQSQSNVDQAKNDNDNPRGKQDKEEDSDDDDDDDNSNKENNVTYR